MALCTLFVVVSLLVATFPGEWHVNLLTFNGPNSVQCARWFSSDVRKGDRRTLLNDRLRLPSVDVVDDEKLGKIEDATKKAGQPE